MALKGTAAVRAGLDRPSGWILIAVNLAILAGVLVFDWNAFDVIFLFWAENIIIGIINVLKMLTARPRVDADTGQLDRKSRLSPWP